MMTTATARSSQLVLLSVFCGALAFGAASSASAQTVPRPSVLQTTLEEANQPTPEITTEELQKVLASNSAPVFDVRTAKEYAIAHIPGTTNIYEKELQQIIAQYPDRTARLILYCNGPSCGKSKRTSEELVAAGYTNVQRYQLGLPVWRALSQTVQTDMPGVLYIQGGDHTAVWVDARTSAEFSAASVPGAVNVQKGEATAANDDGRLPFTDKGTRVVVFGTTAQQARVVAAEIAKKAYWNSSYFGGTFDDLGLAGLINHRPIVVARNASLAAGVTCTATVRTADLDNGSFDPDGGDVLTLAVVPPGPFGLGQHEVALAGTDSRGASASSTAFVTIADASGPSIGEITVRPEPESSQHHGLTLFTIDYSATDNCSSVTTELSAVARNGDDGDAQVVDAHHVLLKVHGRALDEEDEDEELRSFVLTVLATDETGNQSTQSVNVGRRSKDR
jgi:rhodanese-related sulfurtransferase